MIIILIIIFGTTIQEHTRNLAIVLERLLQTGLKLQPDKCKILKLELEYLGQLVTADGIKPNPNKLQAVTSFPTPKNSTQIKFFLGLIGYYRNFIRNFLKIVQPLSDLTKKNVTFNWTEKQESAFQTLKEKLCEALVLRYPDFSKEHNSQSLPMPRTKA